MSLREALHQYCKDNDLKELTCIIHIAFINYTSNFSKDFLEWVNISPLVLNNYIGIGETKIIDLLSFLSQTSPEYILKEYRFNCKNEAFLESYGVTIEEEDFVENEQCTDPCNKCDEFHTYSLSTDKYVMGFSGKIKDILIDLKLTDEDISKELVIMNTNEDHVEKIANLLVLKLNLPNGKEEEAKKGIIKYMHTFREFTKVLSDISGDASKIKKNIVNIGKDATGISDLKDILMSSSDS